MKREAVWAGTGRTCFRIKPKTHFAEKCRHLEEEEKGILSVNKE